jgi:HrpA-like RNA helicase
LGALDSSENLTEIGKKMVELPLPPPHARIVLDALNTPQFPSILIIISMMNVESLYQAPDAKSAFKAASGDHITLLNIY